MLLNIIYNEFTTSIEIDINKKIGIIQEELLNKCSLIIYNIEYSKIFIKNVDNSTYILGGEYAIFDITLKDFLDNININENDIEKIIIYDRKRDLNGNVIKNNIIIDNYTKWYQKYENDNFDQTYLSETYSNYTPINNSHILRFPLESVLLNILNNSQYNIFNNYQTNNVNSTWNNFNLNNENQNEFENETQNETQNEFENETQNENQNEFENETQDENQNEFENETQDENQNEFENERWNNIPIPSMINYIEINNMINIIDNVLINFNETSNIDLQEDVKIILTEDDFNKIESYEYTDNVNTLECLICTEYFENNNILKKLKCNHVFHNDCIKPWLCEESNKCPICRIDTGEGIMK